MVLVNVLLMALLGMDVFIRVQVSELGADDFDSRERASFVLGCLGRLAYPQLKTAATNDDPEVRRRAKNLIRPLQLAAFSAAADREISLLPNEPSLRTCHYFGTLFKADGKRAYVLTDIGVADALKDGGVVNWRGKEYPTQIVYRDEDLSLAWLSIPCETRLPALPLAAGRTVGLRWNQQVDLGASFTENMDLPDHKGQGRGVFTLDESTLQLMLTSVDCSDRLDVNHRVGVTFASTPWKPGPDRIRQFLEHCK